MDMDTNGNKAPTRIKNAKSSQQPLLPEQDIYIHLLVLLHFIDADQIQSAICDGVIEATINHAQGYMPSKQTVDVYSTDEP
nr:probable 26S proteasome non-ATPase regulatory subunit 3 [Parasteatoda tepidariorum]